MKTGEPRTYGGAVALVTGAASGIGRALAQELVRRGAEVVLADINGAGAQAAAATLRATGGEASAAALDITDAQAFARLITETVERTGRLDYLFNNAGLGFYGEARHYSLADWNRVVDVNLRGTIHGVHAAYPVMMRQGFGHIVNTASGGGMFAMPLLSGYSTTKHALMGLSKALRIEAARWGVRVSVLCPGVIRTPFIAGGFPEGLGPGRISAERQLAWWKRMHPMEPEAFATAALDRVARNEPVIVVPGALKVLLALYRLFPGFERFLVTRDFEAALKFFPELDTPEPGARTGR